MARTSLAAAKAELFALLSSATGVPTVAGVTQAYDYDPGLERITGRVSLVLSTAAITPDTWVFSLRLLANASADPRAVQQSLDTLMPAVTAKVTDRFGAEAWTVGPHPDAPSVMVCEWLVECGRED